MLITDFSLGFEPQVSDSTPPEPEIEREKREDYDPEENRLKIQALSQVFP